MRAREVSSAFTTDNVKETGDFYKKHLGAKITFDCGWYINMEFGTSSATLQFMSPQRPEHHLSSSAGLIYNFHVDDVNGEYERIKNEGIDIIIPLEDHPWGDRGFGIKDPNGITLYIYSEIKPSEEFKKFYKN